ncbi:hypothetical protein ACA910_020172 [Epithemia clementina (nom. ined.)]
MCSLGDDSDYELSSTFGDDFNDNNIGADGDISENSTNGDNNNQEEEVFQTPQPNRGKKRRRQWTSPQKLAMLTKIEEFIKDKKMSARAACDKLGISNKQYLDWKRKKTTLKEHKNRKAKSI